MIVVTVVNITLSNLFWKVPKEGNGNAGGKQETALHAFQSLVLIMTRQKLPFLTGSSQTNSNGIQ